MKPSEKVVIRRMKEFPKRGQDSVPLLERARIEVYIPDLPDSVYGQLRIAIENEFTYLMGTKVRPAVSTYGARGRS